LNPKSPGPVILSEAKNLALSSYAISHFHRQSEIRRFAQDDSEGPRMTGWLILSHHRGIGTYAPPMGATDWRAQAGVDTLK